MENYSNQKKGMIKDSDPSGMKVWVTPHIS